METKRGDKAKYLIKAVKKARTQKRISTDEWKI